MKAAVFYGKNDLRVEERDMPEIGKNDVLVRVHACGICGTDVHIFCGDEGAAPTPENTVLGHEFAGEVVKVGADVKSVTADIALDPKADNIPEALKKQGLEQIDVVIECVGRPETIEQAIALAGKYSTVMMFGLTKPDAEISVKPFEIFKKEITLKSSYINPYTFPAAIKLIESEKLDVSSMIYKTEPLTELPSILADGKRRGAGKYIITM